MRLITFCWYSKLKSSKTIKMKPAALFLLFVAVAAANSLPKITPMKNNQCQVRNIRLPHRRGQLYLYWTNVGILLVKYYILALYILSSKTCWHLVAPPIYLRLLWWSNHALGNPAYSVVRLYGGDLDAAGRYEGPWPLLTPIKGTWVSVRGCS